MMRAASTPIVVIGLGQMGSRYAQRFLEAGFGMTVWNRSQHKTTALAAAGAHVAQSAAAAIDAADFVVVALENEVAFESTLLGAEALARIRPTHLVIDTGTVRPDFARTAYRAFEERRAAYLDAPVSGGTRGAAEGRLTIFVGGDADSFERARPVLELLGKPHLVGATGAGQIAKLVNQVMVAVTIGAVAEGLFLAERAGLDGATLLQALQGGFADSRILREHGERMSRRNFAPGAANRIFLKDLMAIEALASDAAVALPLTRHAHHAYRELVLAGEGERDHSSYLMYLQMLNATSR